MYNTYDTEMNVQIEITNHLPAASGVHTYLNNLIHSKTGRVAYIMGSHPIKIPRLST